MKKILLSVTLGVFLIGFFACGGGGGKYAEVKDAMEDMFDAMDTMTAGLDKAGNADDVVKVLNSFADTMGKLSPRIKELQEKYPEIKDQQNLPEELKDFAKKFEELAPKMMGAMGKLAQYASDPKVQAAQKKFMEAMSGLE